MVTSRLFDGFSSDELQTLILILARMAAALKDELPRRMEVTAELDSTVDA
jgi:hypothetical protein